jgi:prepilin-type N-terminal cleavage/methylation domain-containing protein
MQGSHITRSDTASPGSHICHPEVSRRVLVAPNCRVASSCDAPSSLRPHSRRRRAFTLTELLVVIAIIGVLASLITAAAVNALRNAKRARIVLEIKQLATATENFKNDNGAYPPSATVGVGGTVTKQQLISDYERMGKKLSSRIHPTELLVLRALAGDTMIPTAVVQAAPLEGKGVTAAEAVYFWLGGFSQDPRFPISGPGGPSYASGSEVLENRNRRYEFDLGRLGRRNDDGVFWANDLADPGTGRYITYNIDLNGDGDTGDEGEERVLNLWQYSPQGSEEPFVYFDASRYKPYQYDPPSKEGGLVYAIKAVREGLTSATDPDDLVFKERFQFLHCGLDDAWGDFEPLSLAVVGNPSDVLVFPEGPFTGELADTLTNFTNGDLADEAEE